MNAGHDFPLAHDPEKLASLTPVQTPAPKGSLHGFRTPETYLTAIKQIIGLLAIFGVLSADVGTELYAHIAKVVSAAAIFMASVYSLTTFVRQQGLLKKLHIEKLQGKLPPFCFALFVGSAALGLWGVGSPVQAQVPAAPPLVTATRDFCPCGPDCRCPGCRCEPARRPPVIETHSAVQDCSIFPWRNKIEKALKEQSHEIAQLRMQLQAQPTPAPPSPNGPILFAPGPIAGPIASPFGPGPQFGPAPPSQPQFGPGPQPAPPLLPLPIPGAPKLDLPVPGAPKIDLPVPGAPKLDLPVPGAPKLDLPISGAPKLDLPIQGPIAPAPGFQQGPMAPPGAAPAPQALTVYAIWRPAK